MGMTNINAELESLLTVASFLREFKSLVNTKRGPEQKPYSSKLKSIWFGGRFNPRYF